MLWPVAIVHAVIMKPETGSPQAELYSNVNDSRDCPYCAERIKRSAIVCKHCGRDIEPAAARQDGMANPWSLP
jgi:hypothetical protein